MKRTKPYIAFSILYLLIVIVLLVTGNKTLLYPILETPHLPFGNILTWTGYVVLPAIFFYGHKNLRSPKIKIHKVLRQVFILLIFLGLFWGIIGRLLSGNWSNSFMNQGNFIGSHEASKLFWTMNYSLAIAPLVLFVMLLIVDRIRKTQ